MEVEIDTPHDRDRLVFQAAAIVAAYVGNNAVEPGDISRLIVDIHKALLELTRPEPIEKPLQPAAPVRKSVFPDYIICLEDGLKFKSLKRHLRTLGLTPDLYRAKWGLPDDYPMVAPNYSTRRSKLAFEFGLGANARKAQKNEK